ncbi:MAG: aminoacyl-tRNA hydrolase [Gammaproteobacteria bacterium]|jgi:peptidyl-tRNA hydrolase, PTH2 family
MNRVKQVILIRKDLTMRRGKEIAQGSHAAMAFLVEQLIPEVIDDNKSQDFTITLTDVEKIWLSKGVAKVCLRVNSEQELLEHHKNALDAGLSSHLIQDSGRTEFKGQPTYTACAIGPDEVHKIDVITGDLVPY